MVAALEKIEIPQPCRWVSLGILGEHREEGREIERQGRRDREEGERQ